jgi:3-dehydroquinate dehydratase II
MTTVYVLNGPNLNLLGLREPEIYGEATLADVEQSCLEVANELGWDLAFRQTNREGELVDWVQEAGWAQSAGEAVGAVLNAAAYTHTSVALYDAIAGSGARVIELHISNVFSREQFRHHSYVSPAAAGMIAGFGVAGYPLALRALAALSS